MKLGGQGNASVPLPRGKGPGGHNTRGWWDITAVISGYRKFRPHLIRSPDRPAPSKSLYRLSYPGPKYEYTNIFSKHPTDVLSHKTHLSSLTLYMMLCCSTLMAVYSRSKIYVLYDSDSGRFSFLPAEENSTELSKSLPLQLLDFAGHMLSFGRFGFV